MLIYGIYLIKVHFSNKLIYTDKSGSSNKTYQTQRDSTAPLWRKLVHVTRSPLVKQFAFAFISAFLAFGGPLFLNRILTYIQYEDSERYNAIYFIFALFTTSLLKSCSDGQIYFNGRRVGTQIRSILVGEIYKKALRRVQSAAGGGEDENASVGRIVTLMSVDSERVRNVSFISFSNPSMSATATSFF